MKGLDDALQVYAERNSWRRQLFTGGSLDVQIEIEPDAAFYAPLARCCCCCGIWYHIKFE